MGVSSLLEVAAKMAFSVRTLCKKMTETGMKMMYIVVLLYVSLAMYAQKVPFLPQPPVDSCVWHFPVKNYSSILSIWSCTLANKSQKCRFPALDGEMTLTLCPS